MEQVAATLLSHKGLRDLYVITSEDLDVPPGGLVVFSVGTGRPVLFIALKREY